MHIVCKREAIRHVRPLTVYLAVYGIGVDSRAVDAVLEYLCRAARRSKEHDLLAHGRHRADYGARHTCLTRTGRTAQYHRHACTGIGHETAEDRYRIVLPLSRLERQLTLYLICPFLLYHGCKIT